MSRNLVLFVLVVCVGGALTLAAGQLGSPRTVQPSPRDGSASEQRAWWCLWAPLLPALLALAALVGWALQEPAVTDELLSPVAFLLAIPFALVVLRAGIRAARALLEARRAETSAASTIGLWWPQVRVSPRLREALSPAELAAVLAHEWAHAQHRDPLRIWLAQLATDLQGPSASARARFVRWLAALEQARDDEARRAGTAGEDLGAAILVALRCAPAESKEIGAVATLTPAEIEVASRVRRLLAPLPASEPGGRALFVASAFFAAVVAVAMGFHFGDAIVRALPFVV